MANPVTLTARAARESIALRKQVLGHRMRRDVDAEVAASNASYAKMREACAHRATAGRLPFRVSRLVDEAIWRNRP